MSLSWCEGCRMTYSSVHPDCPDSVSIRVTAYLGPLVIFIIESRSQNINTMWKFHSETFLKCSILRVLGLAPETTATRLELKSLSAMYTSRSSAMLQTWSTEVSCQLMVVNILSSTWGDCQLAMCKYHQKFELKTHHFCRQGQGHLWSWGSRGSSPLACQPRRIW